MIDGEPAASCSATDPGLWWVRQEVERSIFDGPPATIGRYQRVRLLGEGGMGIVFRATDPELDRQVALKLLQGHHGGPHGRERLLREAQAMARLSHQNVVHVYDCGVHEGHVFLAMEYVHGTTLDAWLGGAPRPWTILRDLFLQIGSGLAAAHRVGVIHRDLSPKNILVNREGQPKIVDFGLALTAFQLKSSRESMRTIPDSGPSSTRLTRAGERPGTWRYMAPEQHNGAEATYHSDQYSFCLLLWEALHGHYPFPDHDETTNADAKGNGPPTQTRRRSGAASVPARIRRVLQRGLDPTPQARWPDMPALLSSLASDPWRRRVSRSLSVGLIGALLLAGHRVWAMDEPGRACKLRADQRIDAVTAPLNLQRLLPDEYFRLEEYIADLRRAEHRLCGEVAQADHFDRDAAELAERTTCLERRLLTLGDLVGAHAGSDPVPLGSDDYGDSEAGLFQKTYRRSLYLPSIAACADARGARSGTPALAQLRLPLESREYTRALAEVGALEGLGDFERALAQVEALSLRIDPAREPELDAEADLVRGRILRRLRRYDDAELALGRAEASAEQTRRDDIAASALLEQVRVQLDRTDGELELHVAELLRIRLGRVRTAIDRLGAADPLELEHLDVAYNLAVRSGDAMELPRLRRRSIRMLRERADAMGPGERAEPLRQGLFRRILRLESDPIARKALHDEAVGSALAALGRDHAITGRVAYEAGKFHLKHGDGRIGVHFMEMAIAGLGGAFGPDSPDVLHAHFAAGTYLARRGESKQARRHAQAALDIGLANNSANDIAFAANLLAVIDIRLGDPGLALESARRALDAAPTSAEERPWRLSLQILQIEALVGVGHLRDALALAAALQPELTSRSPDLREHRAELRLARARAELTWGQADVARTILVEPGWEADAEAMTDELKLADYYQFVAELRADGPSRVEAYAEIADSRYRKLGTDGARRRDALRRDLRELLGAYRTTP